MGSGMSHPEGHLDQRLAEVAGPWMYRRNAFRLAGLPVHASRRDIRHQRQRLLPLLERNIPVEIGGELPPVERPSVAQLRAAFDALDDPRTRLAHELFWLWGEPDGCGCPATVHSDHDAAVLAHARVLDAEIDNIDNTVTGMSVDERDDLWDEASEHWDEALLTNAVHEHLRYRAQRLDDPRLSGAVPDDEILKKAIQRACLASLAGLLTNANTDEELERLADCLHFWDVDDEDIIDAVVAELSEPLLSDVHGKFAEVDRLHDSGDYRGAANLAQTSLAPVLARLRILASPEDYRPTAAAMDQAAIRIFNAVVAFLGPWPGRVDLPGMQEARQFLDTAKELATDPQTRLTIAGVQANLNVVITAGPAWSTSLPDGNPAASYPDRGWPPGTGISAEELVSQWRARVLAAGDGRWLPVLIRTWRSQVNDPALAFALDGWQRVHPVPRWHNWLFRIWVLGVCVTALWVCFSGPGWVSGLGTCIGGVVLFFLGAWIYAAGSGPVISRHLPWLGARRERP